MRLTDDPGDLKGSSLKVVLSPPLVGDEALDEEHSLPVLECPARLFRSGCADVMVEKSPIAALY